MSSPSTHSEIPATAADASPSDRLRSLARNVRAHVVEPVRVVGFWTAIALPFVYVPLLATGLETVAETAVFFALLAANLVALAIGHSYTPE